MKLAIIMLTVSVFGLGYAMYKSTVAREDDSPQELQDHWYIDEQPPVYPPHIDETEIANMLYQLREHLDIYHQYYEQKIWEGHNCQELAQQCMALGKNNPDRDAVFAIMSRDVTAFNKYLNAMRRFSQHELDQGWQIALELKNMRLHNPEQAAIFDKCWEELVPYVIHEKYVHNTLSADPAYREQLQEDLKWDVIHRKQEYAVTHRERLQWEHDYNHILGEKTMADAELLAAQVNMEAADHKLAVMLGENGDIAQQTLVNAHAQAEELAFILREAVGNCDRIDRAKLELETAKLRMEQEANLAQTLQEHIQPEEELHPSLYQGVGTVPGNDAHPPANGGGWVSDLIEWVINWWE